jgi:hypothetical protein
MSQISRFTISMGAFAAIVLALFVPVQAQTPILTSFRNPKGL